MEIIGPSLDLDYWYHYIYSWEFAMIFHYQIIYAFQLSSISVLRMFKGMDANEIKKDGKRKFLKACAMLNTQMNPSNKRIFTGMGTAYNYCRGHYESYNDKDYDKAKMYFVFSIASVHDGSIVAKVMAMIGLIDVRHQSKEYLLSRRLLGMVRKLCGKYFMTEFIGKRYGEKASSVGCKYKDCEDTTHGIQCAYCTKRMDDGYK